MILTANEVTAALPVLDAITALRSALEAGLDPEAGPPRTTAPLSAGHLLVMPAEWGRHAGVKVVSVAPGNVDLPRIQGHYLLLDAKTLAPLRILDGIALTAIRTAAVSALAVDALAPPGAARLVVFGAGPQAYRHVTALHAIRPVSEVIVVGRDPDRRQALVSWCKEQGLAARNGAPDDVADADLVVCATTARTPLFDGSALPAQAVVVAVGSHEPDAAELDRATMTRGPVVVEARSAALREAGDVIQAGLGEDDLVDLATLVRDGCPDATVFKSVGMAWEDLVLAAHVHESA
ncbi:ornithine cyclodeaminase family protein [Labedaea rhizosphaerae]|uniref:Ornithine cyclodeaminase n=1 Tax=Labedaea rhizosphaerae TaxID=598644 RepID=A0A4R6RVT1_LABRH|nr:ornithine cyclodeaminase family protein [Labedaea rhizosphaerae]TDP91043.1 ornithine cyclodeaminase [Labedaea rhizosphaerae]